jgi:hypothetical protein
VSVRTVPIPYARELNRYAGILGSSPISAFAAIGPTELDEGHSEGSFEQAFSGFQQPFGGAAEAPGLTPVGPRPAPCGSAPGCQSGYYAIRSVGPEGALRVIFLDDSTDVEATQREWLSTELGEAAGAREPAIVIGQADLNAQIVAGDGAAAAVARMLVKSTASASGYFYDSPERNVTFALQVGGESIPTFGSGTLGYVRSTAESSGAFLGASGFLLGQVDFSHYDPRTNRALVTARLIPNIGELAMEAKDGTLLHRSQAALFDGLARRPRAGNRAVQGADVNARETDPYIPIPSNCVGASCANGLFPEYTFKSSRPGIGDFVEQNLAVSDPHAVLLGANGKPVPDATSGLFCAYNAGTTIVTISAGGLSSSLPVTVQAGSVRQPCGTQPAEEIPTSESAVASAPPPPAPAPTPAGSTPSSSAPPLVPVPPVPLVASPAPAQRTPPLPTPFFLAPAIPAPLLAAVPPPVPTPARPTPPSGTSAVTSPVEAPEREEEEEEATESVGNKAVAYRAQEHELPPAYIIGVIVLAAFAGASARRRPRRGLREVTLASATVSTSRSQRRMGDGRRRLP